MDKCIELFLSLICRLVSFAVESRVERVLSELAGVSGKASFTQMEERASKLRHSLAAVWAARHTGAGGPDAQRAYDESWALLGEFWTLTKHAVTCGKTATATQ